MIQALSNPFADYLHLLAIEPESDEPELDSDRHREQIDLLIRLLKWLWRDRQDIYVAGNLTVYYSPNQRTTEDFRGPDVFVVQGTQKRDRRSWVVWNEQGKYPDVVIELLSDSTAKVDRTTKKDLYQTTWRVPEYFWFHPETLEFQGFALQRQRYEPIPPNPQGWLWSETLQLFLGIHGRILRFYTLEGVLVPLPEEEASERAALESHRANLEAQRAEQEAQRAEQEAQRAEQEAQRAEQEAQRAEQAEASLALLRQTLYQQGIDPDDLLPPA